MRVKGLIGYSAEEGVKEGANGGRRECWVVFGYWKPGEQLKLRFGCAQCWTSQLGQPVGAASGSSQWEQWTDDGT